MRKDYVLIGSIHDIDNIPGGKKQVGAIFEMPEVLFPADCNTVVLDKKRHDLVADLKIIDTDVKEKIKEKVSYWDLLTFSKLESIFGGDKKDYAPLFFVSIDGNKTTVRSQLRYTEQDIVYIKTGEVADINDCAQIYIKAVEFHAQNHIFLDNYQCYYRKMQSGIEIEYKYNILNDTDPWVIANSFYTDLLGGKIPEYVCEYGDVLQKWDYMNYMFYVYGEGEGYISVIPQTNGKYLLKRKIYKEDSLARTELHYKDEIIDGSFKEFIENKFNVTCVELPPFRRIRYDIDMENINTGNVFGVFFDYITIEGKPQILKQCEIEYLRTRSLCANDEYPEEQLKLKKIVNEYLTCHGVEYEETFYSKLSFLLDACEEKKSDFK